MWRCRRRKPSKCCDTLSRCEKYITTEERWPENTYSKDLSRWNRRYMYVQELKVDPHGTVTQQFRKNLGLKSRLKAKFTVNKIIINAFKMLATTKYPKIPTLPFPLRRFSLREGGDGWRRNSRCSRWGSGENRFWLPAAVGENGRFPSIAENAVDERGGRGVLSFGKRGNGREVFLLKSETKTSLFESCSAFG